MPLTSTIVGYRKIKPQADDCLSCLLPSPLPSSLEVHGRTVSSQKTKQGAANWDIIRKVKEVLDIPVVANGGIETGADAERLLEETGADAVMSSEGLLENPALFDSDLIPMEELQGVEVWRVPLVILLFILRGNERIDIGVS